MTFGDPRPDNTWIPPSVTPAPCPSCGHCPTCGRGGVHITPYTYPVYPGTTPWPGTITVTYSNTTNEV